MTYHLNVQAKEHRELVRTTLTRINRSIWILAGLVVILAVVPIGLTVRSRSQGTNVFVIATPDDDRIRAGETVCFEAADNFREAEYKMCDAGGAGVFSGADCHWKFSSFFESGVGADAQRRESLANLAEPNSERRLAFILVFVGHDAVPVRKGGAYDSNFDLAWRRADNVVSSLKADALALHMPHVPIIPVAISIPPSFCTDGAGSVLLDAPTRRRPVLVAEFSRLN